MTKVVHFVLGLGKGGAETMLYQVLKHQQNRDIQYCVLSFGVEHFYEEAIRSLGVELVDLNIKHRPINTLCSSIKHIKKADILCTWMYKANFLGYFLGKVSNVKKIVWCIRHSDLTPENNKRSILFVNWLCARISKNVDLIAYNGIQARKAHEEMGYSSGNGIVIDNGCDCNEYERKPDADILIKSEFAIPKEKKIILSVARNAPIKDLPTFIKTIAEVKKKRDDVVALMCGTDVDLFNKDLIGLIEDEGLALEKEIYPLGLRNDIPILMSACDIYILHSAGEAFPNTLLQAMAAGCICIATNVGDVSRIMNNKRFIVEVHDYSKMAIIANELLDMSNEEKELIRRDNEQRAREFDIRKIVKTYESLWE